MNMRVLLSEIPKTLSGSYTIEENSQHDPIVLYRLLYAAARRYNNLARAHALPLPQDRTNSSQPTSFPFLRLPSELRNEIYILSLRANESIEAVTHTTCTYDFENPHKPPTPGLLYVCKQVYTEARDILYAVNTFRFRSPDELFAFEERVGDWNARMVRGLHILMSTSGWPKTTPGVPPVGLVRVATATGERWRNGKGKFVAVEPGVRWCAHATHWAAALQRTRMNGVVRVYVKEAGTARPRLEFKRFVEAREAWPEDWEVFVKKIVSADSIWMYEDEMNCGPGLIFSDEDDADL